ncbi:class IV lanthionine synthetase LanL [Streptomyces pacificus]|uniref:non-specific serine/threonine protein kinase n=1 Tax=Streptomyces pacificus TaxID=2705029 RepID=A0A6A0B247_9ACTN|nr:class IV lanthionine synthetase LanL [Streptomyces pacificus]GFH38364.1 protein kinase/lanthionine synthetase C family protein [Streptomyces pacificus]
MTSRTAEVDLEDLLRQALDATGEHPRWTIDADEMWCRLTPQSATPRKQGWKLHVSATSVSAPEVLAKALDVLLREESVFKFARSLEKVGALNTRATPRGSSGKFITVYPRSDTDAARIALELHRATAGLAGPRILSDQPYAVNSLVHYRYGAFTGRRRLSDEGLLVWFIEDPAGNPVEDKRTGRYSPPAWAVSPFPAAVQPAPRAGREPGQPVLLGGRFSVREAIRHTNKGGVYRGTDATTGRPVVIKEARPHVEADATGCDVRDWLRAEARALEKLSGTGLAPELLAMFEHGGHLFLAQEEVPGIPLRNWVAEHFRDVGGERYRADALAQAERLVDLLAAAHAQGCVLRDFTPGNIMVGPDGALRLIDLELAVPADDAALPTTVGTPGFSAPERLEGAPVAPSADYYSLGATVCFVLTGKVPALLAEEPAGRAAQQRLADWLDACAGTLRLPDGTAGMILGLMKDDPAERWDPARARAALRRTERVPSGQPAAAPARGDAGHDATRAAAAGIVDHLIGSMTPKDELRLWPVSTLAGEADPCTVQQGAAGVLAVLTRYFELTGDERLPEVISTAGHWIAARTDTRSPRPGLHFGGRGTAWALYEAGSAVGDRALVDHATALALATQQPTPSYDITHGTAGSGLAAAHLWQRTGDPRWAELVVGAADRLVADARRDPAGVSWPVPAEAVTTEALLEAGASEEAGKRYLGFAHGTAGIASFLLAAAAVSGRRQYLDLAAAAGEGLAAAAVRVGEAAQWPSQAGDVPTAPYWCHGSAGIGSFLLRLWQATGDDRFGLLARQAAGAVVERASRAPLTQCHGLAGNGDFLLDLAAATGDPAYRTSAEALARLIVAERAHRNGHVVFPNEYGEVSTGWSDGSAGILAFLLRTHHKDSRHWMFHQPG